MSLAAKLRFAVASGFGLLLLQAQRPAQIPAILAQIASGKLDPGPLVVEYRDLHTFHGGINLTIRGTGDVEQKVLRVKAGETRKVNREDFLRLAKLLVTNEAWQQRVPDRTPVPDESRGYLAIRYKDEHVEIWEWYNDMKKNQRIFPIFEFMKQIAWQAPLPR